MEWLEKAAEQGNADAQNKLGADSIGREPGTLGSLVNGEHFWKRIIQNIHKKIAPFGCKPAPICV